MAYRCYWFASENGIHDSQEQSSFQKRGLVEDFLQICIDFSCCKLQNVILREIKYFTRMFQESWEQNILNRKWKWSSHYNAPRRFTCRWGMLQVLFLQNSFVGSFLKHQLRNSNDRWWIFQRTFWEMQSWKCILEIFLQRIRALETGFWFPLHYPIYFCWRTVREWIDFLSSSEGVRFRHPRKWNQWQFLLLIEQQIRTAFGYRSNLLDVILNSIPVPGNALFPEYFDYFGQQHSDNLGNCYIKSQFPVLAL